MGNIKERRPSGMRKFFSGTVNYVIRPRREKAVLFPKIFILLTIYVRQREREYQRERLIHLVLRLNGKLKVFKSDALLVDLFP